uniref:DUF6816 domain-containing protein n=1 Tax=Chlorella ohadii TaxID=2649997 RepID=A0A5P4NBB7_9CHLO|nr:chloroplast hypothetical protein 3 [Chlorella ohadii]
MPARGVAFQPPAASAMQPRCQQHAAPPPPQPQQRQQQQPAAALQPQRRLVLGGLLGSLAALQPASAWAEEAATLTAQGVAPKPSSLAARIATQGNVQQPGIQPPWAPKQIFYPRYLFGEWEVEMEFTALRTPLGRQFVPPGFLQAAEASPEEGGLGSRYAFRQRFYSTLPPTLDNELRVNLGLGMPQDAIVSDRAFNTRETTNAFLGYAAVEAVEYDPRDAPLRETVTLSRLAPDMAPLPPRRLELYINHLSSEEGPGGSFLTSELCRQVLLGVRQVEVKDYEIMHEYRLQPDGSLRGRQRSCLYLQPQEPRFFEAGGRAVAVYDYDYIMRRVPPPEDAPAEAAACVLTPKSVWQCV